MSGTTVAAMESLSDWVGVGLTALSLAGAGASWWWSNVSRKAREAARKSEERAARALAAAEEQAADVARLARRFARPDLDVEWVNHELFALRNTTEEDIRVEEILTDLTYVVLRLDVPATIRAGMSLSGQFVDHLGGQHLDEIEVRLTGRAEPFVVALTGRP